jgi:DNA-binding transcriptional regulator YhcF (GntR family)
LTLALLLYIWLHQALWLYPECARRFLPIPITFPIEMNKRIPLKPNRVSQQIAEQIKSLILEGNLKPGENLPSERELSRITGVGRLSIREGLRILESIGVVKTRFGQ